MDLSLPSTCLAGQSHGRPFYQSPTDLQSLFQSPPSEPSSQSSSATGTNKNCFEFNSLLLINCELPVSSELFCRSGDHCQLPGQPVSVGLLQLPLSELLFRAWRCGSVERRPRLLQVGPGEVWGCRASLEDAKQAWRLRPLLGHAEAVPRWAG